jgi:Uma2 family endonuclease
MTAPAKRPATFADIEALPPGITGEIINGVLYTQARPVTRNIKAGQRLARHLEGPFEIDDRGGWIFLVEPEVEIGPHLLVPDVAGWRADRLPDDYLELPRQVIAPDWVCELLSPTTAKRDKGDKARIYATYDVGHVWFVDPPARTLDVFVRRDRDWVLHAFFEDGDDVAAPPFEASPFAMSFLWPNKSSGASP